MSWAVEEWKDGLPGRALQKITEMETQLEKLRKEQRQRQLHIDTVEAACEKQKQKVEEAKSEISALKRENQSLMDACDSLQAARQKLSHELQQRETQANCLDGQLTSARLHTDKIEQELKRCKNELECRSSVSSSELQSFSTPHHKGAKRNTSDDKFEQLYEKYSTEVAERKNLENELKVLQIKLVSQTQAATSTSRQAIGRQQASSSVFPWQKQNTTMQARCGLFTGDTPLKRTSTSSVFPWENEPVSATKRCGSALSSLEVVPSKRGSFTVPVADKQPYFNEERELEQRVHNQEMELESYASKLNVAMGQLDSARTELVEKEQSLLKSQNALSRLNIQHEQAVAKVTALEQKLKHVAEEMNCQRQNAESARLAAEQRLKDKEREQQEEVARLEHNINSLDQQLSQTKTKLGQELQHTKNEHNALQAEFDKALLQKQLQEKEVQELKQVLQKANGNVKLHQDMTKDAKCSLEEATKEKNNLSCNLEQSAHRVRKFEDDMKNLKQELYDSQRLQEDLQRKVVSQETEVENLKSKLEKQSKSLNGNVDNLKIIISDLEKKRDISLAAVKKNELEMEKVHFKLSASTTENEDLKNKLCHMASECSSLEDEKASLIQLKKEMSDNLNKLKLERDGLSEKVHDLEAQMEQTLSAPLEKQNTDVLEQENKIIKTQLCELKQALDNKCLKNTTLKEKVWALQEELEESVKKQGTGIIELTKSSTQFSEKVAGLEHQLNFEKNANAELKEETAGLERQLTNINNLMKSKEHLFESKEAELKVIKDALLKIVEELEKAHWTLFEEKGNTNEEFGHKMLDTPEQNLSTIEPSVRLMHYFTILREHLLTLQSSLIAHKQTCSELEIKYESQLLEMSKAEVQTLEMSALYTKLQHEFYKNTSKMEEDLNEQATQLENIKKVLEEKNTNLNDISKKLEDTQANLVLQQERNTILQLDLEEAHHNLIMKSKQLEGYATQSKESDRESQCNELQEDVRELQAQNVTLQQEKEQLLKLQDENEALINNFKSQLQQAEHYSLQTKKQASKAEKELANLQEQYMTSVEKQRKLEYMLSEQDKELTSKILEIAQVKDNSHEALEQLMSAIKQLEESKCELVEKLKQAELQDNTNNNKIAYLMAEAESEVKQFNEEMTMLNCRLSDVQEDNQALRLSNQNLEQKICENEQHLESREEKISGNLEMLQMDLEDKDVNLELYESQIKQLKDTIESLDNRLSENEDVDKVRQELEEIRVHCDALSSQLLESQA
uniref:Centromere protein Cenp-F N-terminal domain-containing protein n=1 Tax=Petromyzon marinus TaxID=7757 RepID=S4RMR5_PETMA